MKPLVVSSRTTNPLAGSGQSLAVWLNALAVVQRPTRIVHVGIGDGKGECCVWADWPLTKALAIDAEPIALDVLSANPQAQEVIEVQTQVLAETEGRIAYFVASNASENGLIDPNLLRMVWPSLTLSHQVQRDSSTLDRVAAEMLDTAIDAGAEPLWLIVDALPTVSILSGGTKLLDASSLVCVRALAEAGFRGEPAGADVAAVDRFLEEKGFTRVIYLPGLNPKVGYALYACKRSVELKRPVESEVSRQLLQVQQTAEALTVSLQQTSESLQAIQAKLDLTLQERDAAQATGVALEARLQEQTLAKEQAMYQLAEAKQSAQRLTAALQQSSENLQALQAKLDVTLQERDAARATLDVMLKELDAAQATSATLGAQLQEQTQAKEQALHQLAEAKQSEQSLAASVQQSSENMQAIQAKLDVTLQERDAARATLDVTLKERDAAQATSAAAGAQLQEQRHAKEQALHQLAEAKQSAQSLTAALQHSSENLQACQARLDATTRESDAAQAKSVALGSQLQEQTKVKDQAVHQASEMRQSCDALTAALKTKETALESELLQVQRLTAENNELIHRQKLMNEELVKAEGQITLIKDLLLREQGL